MKKRKIDSVFYEGPQYHCRPEGTVVVLKNHPFFGNDTIFRGVAGEIKEFEGDALNKRTYGQRLTGWLLELTERDYDILAAAGRIRMKQDYFVEHDVIEVPENPELDDDISRAGNRGIKGTPFRMTPDGKIIGSSIDMVLLGREGEC